MPTPWEAAIKTGKQLTVFATPGMTTGSAWGSALFRKIIGEFNRLSALNKLGLTLIDTTTPPDAQGAGGANVQVDVSGGTHSFTTFGKIRTGNLPGTGIDAIGVTHPVSQGGAHVKAFIFLPIDPKIGSATSRGVGEGVKLCIAIHEVIHACGLHESDHTPANIPDVFSTLTSVSAGASSPPASDRVDLGGGKFLPPIFLTPRTAGLIQANWT